MNNFAVFLLNVKNRRIAYFAPIRRLTAALGEKRGFVKDYRKYVFIFFTRQNRRFKKVKLTVFIIQSFSHKLLIHLPKQGLTQ